MSWLAGFGARDAMLLVVALAAVYIVILLLKLLQVGKNRSSRHLEDVVPKEGNIPAPSPLRGRSEPEMIRPPDPPPPVAMPPEDERPPREAPVARAPEGFPVSPPSTFEWDEVKDLFGEDDAAPPPVRRGGFGESLSAHLARSEVEVEMQRMRDEMARMRAEVEALQSARHVSPQYAEAVELAQRGATPQDIADQLGISLAEAELVQALSRGRNDFSEGEQHGEDGYAAGNPGHDALARRRTG